ncbi:DUF2490 domain-containing protein [Bernardetia sp.]|uniref:DUF2490 domain-containing protein n=1 Tax=Bernardetia sp. TaxID=1937974 RepID=UPI0025BF9A37|nr:DUF2490 domain-containing protein [Bernardetia sp.]
MWQRISFTIWVVSLFFSLQKGVAQSESTAKLEETGLWSGVYLKMRFSKHLGYYGEHHYRMRNSKDHLYGFVNQSRQIYNRAGLNLLFSPYFEAVIGPTFVLNFTPDPASSEYEKMTVEPRIWHQWLFIMPPMGRVKFYHQFRFEHRWKRKNNIGASHKYTNRYRYKFFAYVPINKKKIGVKTLFFSPSAEIFLHSGKSVVYHPFEDFRTYNGIGYVINRNLTFFGGHMWTYGQKTTGFEYKTTHIIRINLLVGLDFRSLEERLPQINLGY